MPFAPVRITGREPVLSLDVEHKLYFPSDGSPLVAVFDVPEWKWSPWSWRIPRRTVSIETAIPSNTGIYGPNPPVLSGEFGKAVGPGRGAYQIAYSMVRALDSGRYYLVVRSLSSEASGGKATVTIV